MTRIAPAPHEPIVATPRRPLTEMQKLARWNALGRCCTICGEPCAPYGPTVVWDHVKPLWMGGTNDPANYEPNHTGECADRKTAADAEARARAKRRAKKNDPAQRKPSRLKSRGFDKTRRRTFSGKVEVRT